MSACSIYRSKRWLAAGLVAIAATAVATAVAGCGSSSQGSAAGASPSPSGRTVQVLVTAQRGDLVQSAAGRLTLVVKSGKTTGVAQVRGPEATLIAAGQPAQLVFFKLPAGFSQAGSGQSGQMPASPPAGFGQGGQMSSPPGMGQGLGQGSFGQGGFRRFGGKTAKGTVTAVTQGANSTAIVRIVVAKLPAGVDSKYTGIASIQVKVLATNAVIVPAAAITGTGGNTTVTVIAGGKTSTRKVVVGQKTLAEAQIVSGLNPGENIVYQRTFRGGFGFPRPGSSGFPQPGSTGGQ
jgi:hypothetical protein